MSAVAASSAAQNADPSAALRDDKSQRLRGDRSQPTQDDKLQRLRRRDAAGLRTLTTVAEMRAACADARRSAGAGAALGLVPTMGALHEGHLSLVRAAKRRCDVVAASIFVNPTQFAAGEDLETYPRTFKRDCELLEREGVDLLFAPAAEEMYAPGAATWVEAPEIGARLDGASRPGHFRGVATVVTKLFNVVQPDVAYFGQKDSAQVAVLRAMVRDLNVPVTMMICPTVREADGLAMSSRNRFLDARERVQALALWRALEMVRVRVELGARDVAELRRSLRSALEGARGVKLDYAEIVNADSLLPVGDLRDGALVAVAAWVGTTRLIDNLMLGPLEGV